jgi:tetratricopeptide (TPR) repeat protein
MTDILAQIDRALDTDDLATASTLAERALAQGHKDPIVFNLAAWKCEEEGRFDDAEALLREALTLTPSDPSLHLALGVVLRGQGKLKAAVESFEQAIALDPGYGAAWFERGSTFEKGGAIKDAADDYQRALQLEPDNAAAHAALGAASARRGEADTARHHAERALQLDPGSVAARNALAQLAMEEKKFDDAIALLEPAVGGDDDMRELLVSARTLLGDAYEGAGRYDDAYHSYQRAQTLFHDTHSARLSVDREGAHVFLEKLAASFADADKSLWAPAPNPPASPVGLHVFLTGYPRSGTTLVENILATLPNSVAIEERPTLGDVDRRFLNEADGMQKLAALSEAELDELRAGYWQRAEAAAEQSLAGKIFVDMDPFKGPRLPVIAKLFPQAKVIIMRRDPRDVVWSCFHTSFGYNAGTLAFSSIESTARHYALSWGIAEAALESLPIDWFELRYASLVREFDATTQALCAFLGVPWTDELRKFDRTARERGVSTASATQVRRGLYDGSGGWRRYADRLEPVAPILMPWVERFGFEAR